MKKWDGVVRDGYSIMFDGQNHYEIPPPDGGYNLYHVWIDGKVVAIIGATQYEYMHSEKFWRHRLHEQQQYIAWLADQVYVWNGRKQQLLMSALDVLNMIEEKLK